MPQMRKERDAPYQRKKIPKQLAAKRITNIRKRLLRSGDAKQVKLQSCSGENGRNEGSEN